MNDMSTGLLAGKTALITGAVGTLGRAQAALLADEGAALILLDRPAETSTGEALAAQIGRGAIYVGQDLNDLADSQAAVAKLAEAREIDVLINNAALIINRPFEDFSLDDYEAQIRNQLLGGLRAYSRGRPCDEDAGIRQDRQLLFARAQRPLGRIRPLRRVKGCRPRPDQVVGARTRTLWDPRERRGAGRSRVRCRGTRLWRPATAI